MLTEEMIGIGLTESEFVASMLKSKVLLNLNGLKRD